MCDYQLAHRRANYLEVELVLLDLHLGRPLTRGALTVFPIWNGGAVATRGYDVAGSGLTVSERAGRAVHAVAVNLRHQLVAA